MSESEEEELRFYGTPLDPYDEDAFPKKRPITVEEQVARDAQGRRRFHGAFTGGFSAGFYNTVGSLEGWSPAEFKSSRSDKTDNRERRPEDYMDDEDLGEFGIAPQTVRATEEYSTSKKRKKKVYADGPIPGQPVLETLLEAGNETVGYFLMKNMNRRRLQAETGPKVYGCVMPKNDDEEVADVPQYQIHEGYKQGLRQPKSNTFGIGYVGLDKSHISLFQPAKLTVRERNNKKLSISGQAFGVGAFEDDDEEIYVKDDLSRYDFELTAESSTKKAPSKKLNLLYDLFVPNKAPLTPKNDFPAPVIPASFTGKHNIKKSRFEPRPEAPPEKSGGGNAAVRAKYLGEDREKVYTPSGTQHKPKQAEKEVNKTETKSQMENILKDRFVSSTLDDDPTNLLEPVKPSETTHGTKEMHAAVKMKMFGPLTRVTLPWQPCSMLCKRFNIPEPVFELNAQKNKKRTKNLIFEYQKHAETDPTHKPGLSIQAADIVSTSELVAEIKEEPSTSRDPDLPQNQEAPQHVQQDASVKDITERVDVSKNMDLFKAVFLSSDESEGEEETNEDEEQQKKLVANIVLEPLVPKIKPTREGILSNIDFSKIQSSKPPETSDGAVGNKTNVDFDGGNGETNEDETDTYGPKLPANIAKAASTYVLNRSDADEWIEKGSSEKKHKKKHKKKEKHKKHKHKSKR